MKQLLLFFQISGTIGILLGGFLGCSQEAKITKAECKYYFDSVKEGHYNWTECKDKVNRRLACSSVKETQSCKCLENGKEVSAFKAKGSPFGEKNEWSDRKTNTAKVCGWDITIKSE